MLTLPELLALIRRLEVRRRELQVDEPENVLTRTARQVRYLEQVGLLKPRGRTNAGVRLYDAADVALVWLVVRLRRKDVPMWAVKGILANWGPALREIFTRSLDRIAVVDGLGMTIVKRQEAPRSRWTFDLWAIREGAREALHALRDRRPEVTWAGWHTMPAYQAAQSMVKQLEA